MAMKATFKAMYPASKQNPGLKKAVKAAHSSGKAWNAAKGVWEEIKHPRDSDGKFASKPGLSIPKPPKTPHLPGKKAPKVKGHKPNYMPPPWSKIKGTNAKADGHTLYTQKLTGKFKNDHEMYLAAAKLAAAYKKKHPGDSNVASANQIYNAALRHEIDAKGKHTMLPQLGVEHKAPDAESPKEPSYSHGKTPGGVKMSSKFLAPGQIKPTGKKMQGVNGAMVYEDSKGNQWLVKFPGGSKGTSKAYSNNKFLVDLDIATSRLQNKAGLPVPSIHGAEVDGKYASVHKMYSRAEEPFKDGQGIDLQHMTNTEILEIQKNMVFDWLISNHDAHSGNFLSTDKGIIGIDKGQAFKYFGKDKLSPKFGSDLNPPLAPNKPVYSTLMAQYIDGKGELASFNEGELAAEIQRLQNIPDDEYKALLRPYAEQAAAQGLLSYSGKSSSHDKDDQVTAFLAQATKRKNNLAADFANLQKQLDDDKAMKAKVQIGGPPKAGKSGSILSFDPKEVKVGDKITITNPDGTQDDSTVTIVNSQFMEVQASPSANGTFMGKKTIYPEPGVKGTFHDNWGDKVTLDHGWNATDATKGHMAGQAITDLDFKGVKVGDNVDVYDANENNWTPVKVTSVSSGKLGIMFHDGSTSEIDEAIGYDSDGNNFYTVQWHDPAWGPTIQDNVTLSPPKQTSSTDKLAPGYEVLSTSSGTFTIKKPTGELSKNAAGTIKEWPTKEDAINSSTMAKYKTQAAQQAQSQMSMAQTQASNATDLDTSSPPHGMTSTQASEFNSLKAKILAGQHTPEDFAQFKAYQSKIAASKKSEGAAMVIETPVGHNMPVVEPPAKPSISKKKLGGMSWKGKGGAPTPFDKIPGPQVKEMGQELWERKQKGEFDNVYELYKAATQLSNQQKAAAAKANPGKKLEVGVDYSSANQIRNAALRHEFEATGTVVWETKAEKTSGEVKQTAKAAKSANALHLHVPVHTTHTKNASGVADKMPSAAISDTSKPVGSYENPHAFISSGYGSQEMYDFGRKYTSTTGWDANQKSAFYSFTGSGSSVLNPYLRTGEVPQYGSSKEHLDKMRDNMDAAFNAPQVKPLDDWTIVTRGTGGGWEFGITSDTPTLEDFQAMVGKTVQNKAFISSSIGYPPAFAGNPIHVSYKLPPGFRGIFCGNSSSMTSHTSEREWILPRNLQYKVLQVESKEGKTHVVVEVVGVGK